MNHLFPAFLNLAQQPCTVIGGGRVAWRKIRSLLDSDAVVRVVAPACLDSVRAVFQEGRLELLERPYTPKDLDGSLLVIAATNQREINAEVARACAARRILCNVVDDPDAGTFQSAPTYTCGDLRIAVSTNGASPALARRMTRELAERYPEEYAPYLHYLRRMRQTVKEKIPEQSVRTRILQRIAADADLLAHCRDPQFCRRIATLDYDKEMEQWL